MINQVLLIITTVSTLLILAIEIAWIITLQQMGEMM